MKVGFFDSGLGGLTILRAVRELLPQYDYHFYGDTAHLPLGDKTEEEIYEYTKDGVRYLFEHGAQIVIVACNTASSETLRRLQDTFLKDEYPDRVILGVIIPTIEAIIDAGVSQVLLVGTKRTIESQKYERELKKRNRDDITIIGITTPTLVPYIEAGDLDAAFDDLATIIDLHRASIDSIVLGCTHYTLLRSRIEDRYGRGLRVISQDQIIPEKFKEYIDRHPESAQKLTSGGSIELFCTKEADSIRQMFGY